MCACECTHTHTHCIHIIYYITTSTCFLDSKWHFYFKCRCHINPTALCYYSWMGQRSSHHFAWCWSLYRIRRGVTTSKCGFSSPFLLSIRSRCFLYVFWFRQRNIVTFSLFYTPQRKVWVCRGVARWLV